MSERRIVTIDLRIIAETDRDPWEFAEGLARYLDSEMNDNKPDDWQDATVKVLEADY